MNRQNLYLLGGLVLIFSSRLFENPYIMGGMALLGTIIIFFGAYKVYRK